MSVLDNIRRVLDKLDEQRTFRYTTNSMVPKDTMWVVHQPEFFDGKKCYVVHPDRIERIMVELKAMGVQAVNVHE